LAVFIQLPCLSYDNLSIKLATFLLPEHIPYSCIRDVPTP